MLVVFHSAEFIELCGCIILISVLFPDLLFFRVELFTPTSFTVFVNVNLVLLSLLNHFEQLDVLIPHNLLLAQIHNVNNVLIFLQEIIFHLKGPVDPVMKLSLFLLHGPRPHLLLMPHPIQSDYLVRVDDADFFYQPSQVRLLQLHLNLPLFYDVLFGRP